jgi:hypothetical protein
MWIIQQTMLATVNADDAKPIQQSRKASKYHKSTLFDVSLGVVAWLEMSKVVT